MGLCIRLFVGGDGNPVLAAEPMFRDEAPDDGQLVVVPGFHCSYGLALAQTEQSENDFAGFSND